MKATQKEIKKLDKKLTKLDKEIDKRQKSIDIDLRKTGELMRIMRSQFGG